MSIYALFHLYIPLLLYLFICALCRFFSIPSLKHRPFTQKKKASVTVQTANRCVSHHALPLMQCTNAYPPHQKALIHTPQNERLRKKWLSKESIFPIPCWLLVRSVCGKCFLGVTPSSIPFYCIDFALSVLCSLETNSKGETPGNLSCLQA